VSFGPELHNLKVIGVKEHTTFPSILQRIPKDSYGVRAFTDIAKHPSPSYAEGRTADLGEQRLKDADEGRIGIQILSLAGSINSMMLEGQEVVELAMDINDELKKAVDKNTTRFKALAELPMHIPDEVIKELCRCVAEFGFVGALVSGSVEGREIFG
jgi:uncharacterized protein